MGIQFPDGWEFGQEFLRPLFRGRGVVADWESWVDSVERVVDSGLEARPSWCHSGRCPLRDPRTLGGGRPGRFWQVLRGVRAADVLPDFVREKICVDYSEE